MSQYEIWRHKKHQTPVKIATVGRGVQFYEDSDYKRTANAGTETLLFYDVRGIYSVENTKASDDFKSAYGESSAPQFEMKDNKNKMASDILSDQENYQIKKNSIMNYPNPFNPSTKISYQLKDAGEVVIELYDMLGKKIKTLVSSVKEQGKYSVSFNGAGLPSGIYILLMKINNKVITRKIVLTK